jgi:hypothetical protein
VSKKQEINHDVTFPKKGYRDAKTGIKHEGRETTEETSRSDPDSARLARSNRHERSKRDELVRDEVHSKSQEDDNAWKGSTLPRVNRTRSYISGVF